MYVYIYIYMYNAGKKYMYNICIIRKKNHVMPTRKCKIKFCEVYARQKPKR